MIWFVCCVQVQAIAGGAALHIRAIGEEGLHSLSCIGRVFLSGVFGLKGGQMGMNLHSGHPKTRWT